MLSGTTCSKPIDAVHKMFHYFLAKGFFPHSKQEKSLLCASQGVMPGVNGIFHV